MSFKAGLGVQKKSGVTEKFVTENFSEFPFGLKGQIFKLTKDNDNEAIAVDNLLIGNYVTNQNELDLFLNTDAGFINFQTIFNTWKRFSHGGYNNPPQASGSSAIPSSPNETKEWTYDSVNDQITNSTNSSTYIGFVSNIKLSSYNLKARLSSTNSDDDFIGVVIAFVEDENDLVPNNAFGLDPEDYPGLNVTDEFIPNQHTLSLIRRASDQDLLSPGAIEDFTKNNYYVAYNFNKPDAKIIASGDQLVQEKEGWAGDYVDVIVNRSNDIIEVGTKDFATLPQNATFENTKLTIDLTSDPLLEKFRGASKYGFSSRSQRDLTFSNIEITGTNQNEIFDLRNGDIWIADNAGNWTKSATRNLSDELLPRTFLYNDYLKKSIWYIGINDFKLLNEKAKTYENSSASGAIEIDLLQYDTVKLHLTGNTTLTFINTPPVGQSQTLTMIITTANGTETLTLPATSNYHYYGDLDLTSRNKLALEFSNFITSGLEVDVFQNVKNA